MRRPQNLNKKSPTFFDKTAVFTQQCQNKWEIVSNFCGLFRKAGLYLSYVHGTTGKFCQIFVAFFEKMNFNRFSFLFRVNKTTILANLQRHRHRPPKLAVPLISILSVEPCGKEENHCKYQSTIIRSKQSVNYDSFFQCGLQLFLIQSN